jgi:hypothetical protein
MPLLGHLTSFTFAILAAMGVLDLLCLGLLVLCV